MLKTEDRSRPSAALFKYFVAETFCPTASCPVLGRFCPTAAKVSGANAASGHIYSTAACAAPGRISTADCAAWTHLSYSLCCHWSRPSPRQPIFLVQRA